MTEQRLGPVQLWRDAVIKLLDEYEPHILGVVERAEMTRNMGPNGDLVASQVETVGNNLRSRLVSTWKRVYKESIVDAQGEGGTE